MARLFVKASSQYLSRSDILGLTGYPFTLAGWFNYNAAAQNPALISLSNAGDNTNYLQVVLAGGTDALGLRRSSGATTDALNTSVPTINVWNHFAAVLTSPTAVAIFLNGAAKATSVVSVPWTVTTSPRLFVGNTATLAANQLMPGLLAEMAVWSAALDDAEVQALGNGFTPSLLRPASLLAHWPIWGNDSPQLDRGPGRFDLTLVGSPAKADHPRLIRRSRARVGFGPVPSVAPLTPNTPSPTDAATGVAPTTLTWIAAGATTYDVYFGTTVTPGLVSSGQAGASYAPGALTDGVTYYWKIVAINAFGSTTGPVWSFTAQKPATPNTPSPATLAIGQSTAPTLTWVSARATSYDVYFGTSATPPLVSAGQAGATYTPAGPLLGLTTYYWKIVAYNNAGSTTGSVWSFTTLDPTALVMTLAGVSPQMRIAGLSIRDLLNDAPNTCSFTVDTTAPTVGQDIKIGIGDLTGPNLLFAGLIQTVDQIYEGGKAANRAWQVSAQDYTLLLQRRQVRKRYAQQSATAIVLDLIATYSSGFTVVNVAAGLPTVTGGIDFTDETVAACLTRVMKRVGGYWYPDYTKDVHAFLTEATAAPDGLIVGSRTLINDEPPVTQNTDTTQLRDRDWVEGGGATAAGAVVAGDTILPVTDPAWYLVAGGLVVSGPQRIVYSGVQTGGGGSLVGPGATPSTAPLLALANGSGLGAGVYRYVYTDVTAAGESLPSPLGSITVGLVSAPATAPTAGTPIPGTGPDAGVHAYALTFVTASGETTPSPISGSVTTGTGPMSAPSAAPTVAAVSGSIVWASGFTCNVGVTFVTATGETTGGPLGSVAITPGAQQINLSNIPIGPAGTIARRLYSFSSGAPNSVNLDTINDNSTTTFTNIGTGATWSTTGQIGPTTNTAVGFYRAVPLTALPLGGSLVTARKLYGTAAGGSQLKLVATLNTTDLAYSVTLADASLGANAPTSNTATANQIALTGIAIGASGTTARNVYRTAVNGSQLKFQQTIANNTATTGVQDATGDGSLGANAPITDASGLVQPAGQVNAGSTSLITASPAPFSPSGGWVLVGANQVVRYTGISGNALTGIPAIGVGAILTTVLYGSQAIAAPALTGIPASGTGAILYDILPADPVNILVQVDDVPAQVAMALLEGSGDGIVEFKITDNRLSTATATATGTADLALFSRPIVTIRYGSRDPKTRSGKTIHVDLPSLGLLGDFTIQSVTIDQIGVARSTYPRYTVEASSVRFSFEDVLRRVQL